MPVEHVAKCKYQLNLLAERAFEDKAQWTQQTIDRVHDRLWDCFNPQVRTALSLHVNDPYEEFVRKASLLRSEWDTKRKHLWYKIQQNKQKKRNQLKSLRKIRNYQLSLNDGL